MQHSHHCTGRGMYLAGYTHRRHYNSSTSGIIDSSTARCMDRCALPVPTWRGGGIVVGWIDDAVAVVVALAEVALIALVVAIAGGGIVVGGIDDAVAVVVASAGVALIALVAAIAGGGTVDAVAVVVASAGVALIALICSTAVYGGVWHVCDVRGHLASWGSECRRWQQMPQPWMTGSDSTTHSGALWACATTPACQHAHPASGGG